MSSPSYPSGIRRWLIIITVMAAMLMQVLRILRFGPVRRFAARHGAAPLLEGTCVVRLRV